MLLYTPIYSSTVWENNYFNKKTNLYIIRLFAICVSQRRNEIPESYKIFEQHMLMCKVLLENELFLQKFKNVAMIICVATVSKLFL